MGAILWTIVADLATEALRANLRDYESQSPNPSHVQFHHVLVVQHVVAFDHRAVVDGLAPDAGELQALEKVLVDLPGHVQQACCRGGA